MAKRPIVFIGEVLKKQKRKLLNRTHVQVATAWEDRIPKEIRDHARPSALKRGVLTVEVDSPALRQELAGFRKEEILSLLCEPVVRDLRFELNHDTR